MNNLLIHNEEKDFIESLKQIVHSARKMAYASVNYAQVLYRISTPCNSAGSVC